MFADLDFRTHIPIYVQVVERIERLIATGVLKPGDQLPTVRHMAAELQVNFNTIARAYRLLDDNGVISTQRGRGTYVLGSIPRGSESRRRKIALEGMAKSFLRHAYRVGFDPDELSDELDALVHVWREEGKPP